jgi:hypothetical protein
MSRDIEIEAVQQAAEECGEKVSDECADRIARALSALLEHEHIPSPPSTRLSDREFFRLLDQLEEAAVNRQRSRVSTDSMMDGQIIYSYQDTGISGIKARILRGR